MIVIKTIKLNEYKESMGELINLSSEQIGVGKFISFDKIMSQFRDLLKKDEKYYFYCSGGIRSKKVVSVLEYYGYDVTQVIK